MPRSRYFVLAKYGSKVTELFKLEQLEQSTVITSPLLSRFVEVQGIHVTHHPPKSGRSTRIIHASDSQGTDVRIPLDPEAKIVDIERVVIDLTGVDWEGAKVFARQSYDEVYVLDVEQEGPYVDAHFLGAPRLLDKTLRARIGPEQRSMVIPKKGGFGSVPEGHTVTYARIVFDDEADVTLGCLLLTVCPRERAHHSRRYS